MINKTLRRLAVGASAITVLGVVVPLAAATAASAAVTQTLSVTPTSANIASGGSQTFTVTPNPAPPTNGFGVSYDIYSGPDSNGAAPFTGTACTAVGGGATYTCTITNTKGPGTDKIHFYNPAAANGPYAPGVADADATLTVAGAVNSVALTPLGGSEAQGVSQFYTATATDSAGRPVPGVTITLTGSQANAPAADIIVAAGATRDTAFHGAAAPVANANGSASANGTTSANGIATFNLASEVTGTVAVSAVANGNAGISAATSLTIDPGTANDVTSVVLNPASNKAFTGGTVTEQVTLKNAQGDLVGGVTPSGFVTGPNAASAVTPSGATDGTGTATLSYAATNPGNDTLTGYVNQSNHAVNTGGLDAGEPPGTASVTVATEPAGTTITDAYPGHAVLSNTSTGTTTLTFTVMGGTPAAPLAGYVVNFSQTGASPKYTLGATSAVTNAQGQVTVSVTDATPANNDSTAVTATLAADTTKTDTVTVTWQSAAPTGNVYIQPYAGSAPVGGTSPTYSVAVYDQFGNPVTTGLTYAWSVNGRNSTANNLGATGTGATFSYTDAGPSNTGGTDPVSVTVTNTATNTTASDQVIQTWVLGTGKAAQANIDLGNSGHYVANGPGGASGPYVATDFQKTETAPVSKDYTPANVQLQPVNVALVDANGNPLVGKSVSFSSSGVGQIFTYDQKTGSYDVASGNSGTALVDPCSGANGDPDNTCGEATVYVASNQVGKQTISASVDGITDTATVNYAGNYVPVTPVRLVDTRTGQGDVSAWNSATSGKGGLAPDSLYYFDLSSTSAPLDQSAYVFNVTAIGPNGAGNLRFANVDNCGSNGQVPTTSLINYQPGKDSANDVVLSNDPGCGRNEFVLYSAGASVNVAVDLQGYYTNNGEFNGTLPGRVADTRNAGGSPVAAGTSQSFQIAGTVDSNGNTPVPAGAKAVALNVTAIGPTGVGNLRVYPDGSSVPTTSNINYIPGVDKAAFVVVNLPANGKIDVYSAGSPVNVAIDVFGYYPSTATVVTQAPVRVFDSRTGNGTELKAGVPVNVPVTLPGATNGVPAGAQAVLVSLTAIHAADSTGIGNLRAYPTGSPTPTVSNINYVGPNSDVANFAIVPVGSNGQITLYSAGSNVNATVDILGYVPAGV